MKKKVLKNNIVIYQAKNGAIELRGDFQHETVWATQAQIARVFGIDRTVATKHINNLIKSKEITKKSNVQKMHIANSDKPVTLYSLDVILGVGYRTNSRIAIEFRKWATKTLKEHITKGYTINRKQIAKNYNAFMKSVADIFFWFLRKTKIKTMRNINPNALTALTLLIAESDPNKKDQMTALVTQMLK